MILAKTRSLFAGLARRTMPDYTKRLVVLSTLAALLPSNKSSFDDGAMQKLNALMNLGADPKALAMPVHLTSLIWRGDRHTEIIRCVNDQCMFDKPSEVAERIHNLVPEWLRYGKDRTLVDVETLIRHRSQILA